ncbi:hypothetical protein RD055328_06470 [Companilactobacillus sp. RD055328]|uniref:YpmS family protein n=1 Tax=Companilactobacillus sp. RD055328 TaxID=2916634 RepID=UPI001FC7E9C8|nr:YpmS family protein [Companilactobacillus sp. RD055328]GKQ42724.1 hypothetical protein RD055328_06470 [Companilactobacillus sp. RD055328]
MKRQDKKKNTSRNWWKISFFSFITILIILISALSFKIFTPISETNSEKNIINPEDSIFTVSLTRKQVNTVAGQYIDEFLTSDDIKYKFKVDEKHANILGSLKFLGSNIDFKLVLDPYIKTNGDVQLKAKSLKLGTLPVPLSFVINYIGNTYHLPKWVQMNSKKEIVDLKLTQYRTETGYSVEAKKIDLKNNDIKFEVFKKGNK